MLVWSGLPPAVFDFEFDFPLPVIEQEKNQRLLKQQTTQQSPRTRLVNTTTQETLLVFPPLPPRMFQTFLASIV